MKRKVPRSSEKLKMSRSQRERAKSVARLISERIPNGPTGGDLGKAAAGVNEDLLLAIHLILAIKKQRRSLGRSYCFIATTVDGINASFGPFKGRQKAVDALRKKGWKHDSTDDVWVSADSRRFARLYFIIHPGLKSIRKLPSGE